MSLSQDDFIKLAQELGHSQEFIDDTTKYAERLQRNNLPVIFSTFHLSLFLGIPYDYLLDIIVDRENFYKFYEIKKRNGKGLRQIVIPYSNLRSIQQFILHEILNKVPIHKNANGFAKGKSILTNAIPHKNQNAILQ